MSDGATSDALTFRDDPRSVVRSLGNAWQAIRAITLRECLWATSLGLLAFGVQLATYAPRVLHYWQPQQFASKAILGLLAAYVILLAVGIAEHRKPHSNRQNRRYLIAGASSVILITAAETVAAWLFPHVIGAKDTPDVARLLGVATQSLMNWSLCGGLAIAVYVRLQRVRSAREAIRAAELARAQTSREVLASRLDAMQAHVEPLLLLGTLSRVEALYDRDATSGARMLGGLIAYLRAALPQLRGGGSTLRREAQLAKRYLELVQLQMGSRLAFAVNVPANLPDCAMPPMLLLPLIDHALRHGIEPMPLGGRIDVNARAANGRLSVTVSDNGLAPREGIDNGPHIAALRARLEGLYNANASLTLTTDPARGVAAVLDLPHAAEGAHR